MSESKSNQYQCDKCYTLKYFKIIIFISNNYYLNQFGELKYYTIYIELLVNQKML